jgi:SPP1 family predicted phage head-tail adaptor
MRLRSGALDKRITIQRAGQQDDGFGRVQGAFVPWLRLWARKMDVSDAERVRAAEQGAELTSRFRIRASAEARAISAAHQLVYHGPLGDISHEITGVKDVENDGLEITAVARPDREA